MVSTILIYGKVWDSMEMNLEDPGSPQGKNGNFLKSQDQLGILFFNAHK